VGRLGVDVFAVDVARVADVGVAVYAADVFVFEPAEFEAWQREG
jgi:hypothetical protein